MLSTTAFLSTVFSSPRFDAQPLGYLRTGARVVRAAEPTTGTDVHRCAGGWYRVEPFGYLCNGSYGVTSQLDDPRVQVSGRYPPKAAPLPYGYGMALGAVAYARIPTSEEQRAAEGDIAAWRKQQAEQRAKVPVDKQWPELAMPVEAIPPFLENHEAVAAILGATPKGVRAGYVGHSVRLSFLTAFESEGRPFYLTTEHLIVPADRVKAARLTKFHGVELAGTGPRLPVVWMRYASDRLVAFVYALDGDGVTKTELTLPYQTWASVADADVVVKGVRYHELLAAPAGGRAGVRYLVKGPEATRLDAAKALPDPKLGPTEVWIEVSLSKQTLVVYEGLTPRYTTLISSGAGGKARSTPVGQFRVHQKHVTTRMHGQERPAAAPGEEAEHYYRFDDVPYTQYIVGGIALHAAFWHDGYGLPRSHGCINMSPHDAKYVFERTLPEVPKGWHGIYPGRGGVPMGTLVVIRG